jgi:hypothetical protein
MRHLLLCTVFLLLLLLQRVAVAQHLHTITTPETATAAAADMCQLMAAAASNTAACYQAKSALFDVGGLHQCMQPASGQLKM